MKSDKIYLAQILDSIRKIKNYLRGFDEIKFCKDEKTISAVICEIMIIGEAAGRISQKSQKLYKEIAWPEMIGMRHRLIHGYDEVNLKIVWDTCQRDLPLLKKRITKILAG